MLYIKNGNDYTPIELYKNVEIVEEVGGNLTLSFNTFNHGDNPYHMIMEETVITVGGYDFKIKQVKENGIVKNVNAVSTFFELGGDFIEEIYAGTRLISDFAKFMMKDSGWKYSLDIKNDKHIFIPNFGYSNRLKMIQEFCKATGLEYQIFPNKLVKFAPKEGNDYGAHYRYGHNIKTLDKVVDTTNLKTRIRGFNEDGTYIEMLSDNHKKFGIIDAEPIKDQKFESEAEFKDYLRSQLQDVPEVAITLDTIELTNKELGEHVWLIYEPLELKMSSRILSKTTSIVNNKLVTTKVVIGNFKNTNGSDLYAKQQVEIDKNKKQSISYFEQTNDKIRMAVEEWDGKLLTNKAEWEMTATKIRSELWSVNTDLDGKITKANSRITQTAKEILSEVSIVNQNAQEGITKANSLISQTATSIRSEVNENYKDLNGQIGKANSKIEQTASSITSTVNQKFNNLDNKITLNKQDADGNITRIDKAIIASNSKIEQTATSINSTVTTHYNDLNGKITNTNNRVSKAESRITQTASDITSEVSSNYTDLNGKINKTNSQIQIMTNAINLKVTKNEVTSMISVGVDDGISNATIQADQINFKGSVFGDKATFEGSLETPIIKGGNNEIYFGSRGSGHRIDYQGGGLRFKGSTETYMQAAKSTINFYTSQQSGKAPLLAIGAIVQVNGNLGITGLINGQKFDSKREIKKNIEPMKDNAISKVMTTPIYKYNYIDDLDGELKYTGTIIDEAVSDIVNVDGETINIYSMVSVLWKAVQEQQSTIEAQQDQIDTLKKTVKDD